MLRRPLVIAAGGVLAAGAFYLYLAGGDPKQAEKKFEQDMRNAKASVKSHMPTRSDTEKDIKNLGAKTGAEIDKAFANIKNEAAAAKSKAEAFGKDVKAETTKKIDAFDHKVEEGASKAKSGISSWFGGK